MSDQSTNCQSLGFPKTNTRMQFPAATRSAIPKIYGSIVRSDHLLVKLISTSGAADAATAAAAAAAAAAASQCTVQWLVLFRPNGHNNIVFKADRLLNFCRYCCYTDGWCGSLAASKYVPTLLKIRCLHTKCMVAVMVQQ